MSDIHAQIDSSAKELMAELGLSNEFVTNLNSDDDWSFMIKLHALIEAAMTHALVTHSGNDAARELFARLELNNTRTGTIAFADVYLNLESEDRRFLRSFSELRNKLVHDVRNVSFGLDKYFDGLAVKSQREFVRDFGYVEIGDDESSAILDKAIAAWRSKLRQLVLHSTFYLLAILQLNLATARARRESDKTMIRIAEMLRPKGALD